MTIQVKDKSRAYRVLVKVVDELKSDNPLERDYRRGVLGELVFDPTDNPDGSAFYVA